MYCHTYLLMRTSVMFRPLLIDGMNIGGDWGEDRHGFSRAVIVPEQEMIKGMGWDVMNRDLNHALPHLSIDVDLMSCSVLSTPYRSSSNPRP